MKGHETETNLFNQEKWYIILYPSVDKTITRVQQFTQRS